MLENDLKSLLPKELIEVCSSLNEPSYRGKQLFDWLHKKKVKSFDKMSNLSAAFKEKLLKDYSLNNLKIEQILESKIDGTCKFLFELSDGNIIESVFMKYKFGNSVCISSQVGCRMGCRFCASTIDGLVRNLEPFEMLEQIYEIERYTKERVSHVVVMGAGEPFDNYDNLIKFIKLISCKEGLNISQRNITVSTCGIVPKIEEFADENMQVTLALSLHASNQEKRKSLMPVANKYSLEEVIAACKYFFKKTGRRLTFEYSLVAGVNDTKEDAAELSKLLNNINCHVNLIPVNPVEEREYKQSDKKDIDNFKNKLEKNGINVTIRREMGRDINGACGQLRRNYIKKEA